MPDDELRQVAAEAVQELRDARFGMEDLGLKVDQLERRFKRSRKQVGYLAASLALDLVLTVAMAFIIGHQNELSRQQSDVTNGALCPLYDLIVHAYHPELQKPENLADYNRAHAVIRSGYVALGCQGSPLPAFPAGG